MSNFATGEITNEHYARVMSTTLKHETHLFISRGIVFYAEEEYNVFRRLKPGKRASDAQSIPKGRV